MSEEIFIKNKYTKWYFSIIERAQSKTVVGYSEKHHILPKSLGGNDDATNIVTLSSKEHFICHLLLTRMVSGPMQFKMIKAAMMMSTMHGPRQQRYKITSKIYQLLKGNIDIPISTRNKMSKSQLERFQKNNGTFLGRAHSIETRAEMSQKASRPKSDKWRESASKNRKGRQAHNKGILHSEETKQKIRESVKGEKNGFYGKHHSAEQREKKRQEKLTSPRHTCPYCSKIIDAMNYARWHGNNCKKRII